MVIADSPQAYHKDSANWAKAAVVVLSLILVNTLFHDLMLVFTVFASVSLYIKENRIRYFVLSVFAAALAVLIKFGIAIYCLLFLGSAIIFSGRDISDYKKLIPLGGAIFDGVLVFLRGNLEFTQGYSSGMSLEFPLKLNGKRAARSEQSIFRERQPSL